LGGGIVSLAVQSQASVKGLVIETEAFHLRVVFHDFTVTKLNDEVQVLHKVMFPFPTKREDDST